SDANEPLRKHAVRVRWIAGYLRHLVRRTTDGTRRAPLHDVRCALSKTDPETLTEAQMSSQPAVQPGEFEALYVQSAQGVTGRDGEFTLHDLAPATLM